MKNKSETWESKAGRIINSTLCFATAYILLMGGYYLITALMGKVFGFDAIAYYYGVKFHKNTLNWSKLNITLIYGIGTLFLFLMGVMSTYFFYKWKEKLYVLNLVFAWGMITAGSMVTAQGLIMCLGANEYNSPFYQNLTVVFAWLHAPAPLIYIAAAPFFIAGFIFTFFYGKPFLTVAYSYSKVNNERRKSKFFFETVLVPYILGTGVVLLVTFPLNMWVNIIYIVMIGLSLLLSFMVIRFQSVKMDEVLHYKNLQLVNLSVIGVFLVLISFVTLAWRGFHIPF